MIRFALAAVVVIGLAAPARADFQDGLAAYERGDYTTAFRELKPLAEHGDAAAQLLLGGMYDTGEGVPQDSTEAAKWYRKAAEQGDAVGQYNLGVAYVLGQGVPQDYVLALMWVKLAVANLPPAEFRDMVVLFRDHLAWRMTHAEIAEAEELAREWKAKTE